MVMTVRLPFPRTLPLGSSPTSSTRQSAPLPPVLPPRQLRLTRSPSVKSLVWLIFALMGASQALASPLGNRVPARAHHSPPRLQDPRTHRLPLPLPHPHPSPTPQLALDITILRPHGGRRGQPVARHRRLTEQGAPPARPPARRRRPSSKARVCA
jgi:hypothetical protein